jgi:hypothetical protein
MLDYARQRAIQALKLPQIAVLATTGPAGLQVGEFHCAAVDLYVYLLLPQNSDHLFNIENNPTVTLLSYLWELRGMARIVSQENIDANLLNEPGREWYVLIQVHSSKIQIRRNEGWGNAETIDISYHPNKKE